MVGDKLLSSSEMYACESVGIAMSTREREHSDSIES